MPTPDAEAARRGAILVGLMSGTSLDGISAAVVRFADAPNGGVDHALLGFTHRAYTVEQRTRLSGAMREGTAQSYCRLHADLGHWLADVALAAITESGVALSDVAAIGSHGQTLWHEPGHSTWQIGDASIITERTGIPGIGDFRSRDVAAGGQGAPLVPLADQLLFAHPSGTRALQNIGGIGNATIVPAAGGGVIRAFDTGPGMVLIDELARRAEPTWPYDRDGAIAARGRAELSVVNALLASDFFRREPPKSTGRELFSTEYADALAANVRSVRADATSADVVATAVEFTAASIADALTRFVAEPLEDVIVSGGGAKHPGLMASISARLAPLTVRRFDDVFYDGEAKEAVAFALMAWRHLCARPGNVPSATGARGPRRLGALWPA
jgi:anhydro-N-acetylmuramic acid kinase